MLKSNIKKRVQVILEEPLEGAAGGYAVVERPADDERWAEVARLLSRKRDAISPLDALGLLPGALPLPAALPFLQVSGQWGAVLMACCGRWAA